MEALPQTTCVTPMEALPQKWWLRKKSRHSARAADRPQARSATGPARGSSTRPRPQPLSTMPPRSLVQPTGPRAPGFGPGGGGPAGGPGFEIIVHRVFFFLLSGTGCQQLYNSPQDWVRLFDASVAALSVRRED